MRDKNNKNNKNPFDIDGIDYNLYDGSEDESIKSLLDTLKYTTIYDLEDKLEQSMNLYGTSLSKCEQVSAVLRNRKLDPKPYNTSLIKLIHSVLDGNKVDKSHNIFEVEEDFSRFSTDEKKKIVALLLSHLSVSDIITLIKNRQSSLNFLVEEIDSCCESLSDTKQYIAMFTKKLRELNLIEC